MDSRYSSIIAQGIIAVSGAAAVGLDIAWFGRSYSFFNARNAIEGVQTYDYNDSDHVYVSLAFVAAMTLMQYMLTVMRGLSKAYESSLHDFGFAVAYSVMAGLTMAVLIVSYAYYLVTLPKFNAVYKDAGFNDLRNNGLPTAAFLFTTIYICAQTGYTFATVPAVRFASAAAGKDTKAKLGDEDY
jgi:hypothetical protein